MSRTKYGKGENRSIETENLSARTLRCTSMSVSGNAELPKLTSLKLDSGSATAPICGVATIAAAAKSVTVATEAIEATDLIFLTKRLSGTAANDAMVVNANNVIAGTSFVIQSNVVADTDDVLVDWMIVHRS